MKKYVVFFWQANDQCYIEKFIPQAHKFQGTSRIEDAKVYQFENDGEAKVFTRGLREATGIIFSAESLEETVLP